MELTDQRHKGEKDKMGNGTSSPCLRNHVLADERAARNRKWGIAGLIAGVMTLVAASTGYVYYEKGRADERQAQRAELSNEIARTKTELSAARFSLLGNTNEIAQAEDYGLLQGIYALDRIEDALCLPTTSEYKRREQ